MEEKDRVKDHRIMVFIMVDGDQFGTQTTITPDDDVAGKLDFLAAGMKAAILDGIKASEDASCLCTVSDVGLAPSILKS